MADDPYAHIPRVIVVVNGPLGMSEGKVIAQTFQVAERLLRALDLHTGTALNLARWRLLEAWKEHTTTIARKATTPVMFDRVCSELGGVVMMDEGLTEVPPGSRTMWASWPMLKHDVPQLLKNKKIPLL